MAEAIVANALHPSTKARTVGCCAKCGERAGSISAGTGRPLMLDRGSGESFHVNCRPEAVSAGAALASLLRL
jgi:hypothetical protein